MRRIIGAAIIAACALVGAPAQAATPAEGRLLASALEAAGAGDWTRAEALAARSADRTAADIVQWLRLARGGGGWDEYERFVVSHQDWPNMDRIRAEGERIMPPGLAPERILRFFDSGSPVTGSGALALAAALISAGQRDRADAVLLAAWTGLELGVAELAVFAARHPRLVQAAAFARADAMLWAGEIGQAEAMVPLLAGGEAALIRARVALRNGANGVDGLIAAIPRGLQDDPGLAHDRFEWRIRRDRHAEATALLLERSVSAESLGRPEAWAKRRLQLAHRAMREGDARTAYRLAADHRMGAGGDFEQLEWFAGWVALRKLGDARTALAHFDRFAGAVNTPISKGRAGYWQGRAWEALGDRTRALNAYKAAAAWQTSFYGQLAAERAGLAPDPILSGPARGPDWRTARFMARPAGRAALMFHHADEPGRVWQFLVGLARQEQDPGELAAQAQMALDLGRHHVAVRIAKIAAGRGVLLMGPYYPVTDLAQAARDLPPELVLSIARQESEFNPLAVSPAGARGLMQLMPATAQNVARDLGLDYSQDRLTSDWAYNAALGQGYLVEQLAAFGSVPLVAAAYNAGPHRVDTWLAAYGDPRRDPDFAIDWIETIPFTETRNYVMRVMEGLHVYRARLAGRAQPLRLVADLGVTR